MNENFISFFKKYDRSIVLIITAMFVGISTYVTLKSTVERTANDVVRQASTIKILEEARAVQEEINRTYEKKLDKIEEKLDKIWTKVK